MADEAERDVAEEKERKIGEKIEATGWGAFFIWIGIVLLTGVQTGWALTIIGLITLSGQVARAAFGLRMGVFWLLVGNGFLLGGIWELAQAQVPLVPVLLTAGGLAVILAASGRRVGSGSPPEVMAVLLGWLDGLKFLIPKYEGDARFPSREGHCFRLQCRPEAPGCSRWVRESGRAGQESRG